MVVEIDRGEVEEARRLIPVLQLLRRDLYVMWYGDSRA